MILKGKRILITGGTGSLGKVLLRRLLSCELGTPKRIVVFSRDEAKQHQLRTQYQMRTAGISESDRRNFQQFVACRIGDIRDYPSVANVLRDIDIVFNTAALKQVPSCEYFPFEAVRTNIEGPYNIVRAIREMRLPVEVVVCISTDKACKPVNVMGMTKAIQERLFVEANLEIPQTRFVCVRYGNVLASRGSVIPLFIEQIRDGGPVTITTTDMTRFLLSLNRAADTVFCALGKGRRGETFIPRVLSARVVDVANALIGSRKIKYRFVGIRPGEKTHEVLVSEEEVHRTVELDKDYYVILPALPELNDARENRPGITKEYSSADNTVSLDYLRQMLTKHHLHVNAQLPENEEM